MLIWCAHLSCQAWIFIDNHMRYSLLLSRLQGLSFSALLKLWFLWVLWGPFNFTVSSFTRSCDIKIRSDWTPEGSNRGDEDGGRVKMPLVLRSLDFWFSDLCDKKFSLMLNSDFPFMTMLLPSLWEETCNFPISYVVLASWQVSLTSLLISTFLFVLSFHFSFSLIKQKSGNFENHGFMPMPSYLQRGRILASTKYITGYSVPCVCDGAVVTNHQPACCEFKFCAFRNVEWPQNNILLLKYLFTLKNNS